MKMILLTILTLGLFPIVAQADIKYKALYPATGIYDNCKYCPNNPDKQVNARWMAVNAALNGIPRELPIMASLVETGDQLQNIDYGDRDSISFFQIRPSSHGHDAYWWNRRPDENLKWFLRRAVYFKQQGYKFTKPPFTSYKLGEWAQAVEASGYPERYQYKYNLARSYLSKEANSKDKSNQWLGYIINPKKKKSKSSLLLPQVQVSAINSIEQSKDPSSFFLGLIFIFAAVLYYRYGYDKKNPPTNKSNTSWTGAGPISPGVEWVYRQTDMDARNPRYKPRQ
jgi:hypothetical protein